MPRKTSSRAEAQAQKAQQGRWSYLVRSPYFLKDLRQLHRFYRRKRVSLKSWFDSVERITDKYGLAYIPPEVIASLPFMDQSALESYGEQWGISYTPVMTGELKE